MYYIMLRLELVMKDYFWEVHNANFFGVRETQRNQVTLILYIPIPPRTTLGTQNTWSIQLLWGSVSLTPTLFKGQL